MNKQNSETSKRSTATTGSVAVGADKEIILDTSDKAATYRTGLVGWVSRAGFYFGDNKDSESMARYRGCTHRSCKDCGKPTPKGYLICDECRYKKEVKKYQDMPSREWDGKTPLYSDEFDQYFFDLESAEEYGFDHGGISTGSMRLVICEPVEYRRLDDDYWEECLPEDGELPEDIKKAIDDLNSILENTEPASFVPGKFRLKL